jgi:hypothetical protein
MTTTATPERKTLRELRNSDATLFCKNNTGNKITCNTEKVQFELDPYEIAIMPKECLSTPGMQRLWMRKAVTISDDESMEDEIILLMGGLVEMPPVRAVQVMKDDGTWAFETPAVTETSGKNDIVMTLDDKGQPQAIKCVIGGEPVFQTKAQADEGAPPLCPVHESESHKIVSIQNADRSWSHTLPKIG